jgi:anti-sigma B factor antagonist
MNATTDALDNCSIIRVTDPRSTPGSAAQLKTLFVDQIGQGCKNLLVNLSQIEYIDSSVMGALLFGRRQAQDEGGDLRIVEPSPKVQSMIEIAQLDRVFEIYNDEAAGIASFTG